MPVVDLETVVQPADPFQAYRRRVEAIPPLAPGEERQLGLALLEGGAAARAARERLIRAHLRDVVRLARRFARTGVPMADLVQEGNLGLLTAAERFDPLRGVRFMTYAIWWIRQAIADAARRHASVITPPVRLFREKTAELPISLETLLGPDGEHGRWEGLLADERAERPLQRIELEDELSYLLSLLRPREALILALRFGLVDGTPHSLEAIGRRFGITRQRVMQIEARAMEKLRAMRQDERAA